MGGRSGEPSVQGWGAGSDAVKDMIAAAVQDGGQTARKVLPRFRGVAAILCRFLEYAQTSTMC